MIHGTNHQLGSVSVIDLTYDSLNESNLSNNKDEQIIPFVENKSDGNNSIEAHSSNLSSGKDNSTITSEQPNENVPVVQENIGNSITMENISLQLVGETLSQATI